MKHEIQKMIEKYKKLNSESYYYFEREVYKRVIQDLRKLLLMEVDKERK